MPADGNGWIPDARIFQCHKKTGRTDTEALKTSRLYAIQTGLVQRGRKTDGTIEPVRTGISNFIRLTGVKETEETETVDGGFSEDGGDAANPDEDEEATVVAEDN